MPALAATKAEATLTHVLWLNVGLSCDGDDNMTSTIPQTGSRKAMPDADSSNLVDMAWDPITRIVRSLGIYTKIDLENRRVVESQSAAS